MEQPLENPKPPIFSFANGELNCTFQNGVIRHLERVTGQPKIKRLYLDLDDNRPDELFWSDALDRLSITINLKNILHRLF